MGRRFSALAIDLSAVFAGVLLADLQILWEAAVEKSETIRFAIVKLSNPDGEEAKVSLVKRILSPIANIAPVVGIGLSDPVSATGAMFGGELINSIISDDRRVNERFSKVTDADLVMLAQETDALQEKLVILYYNYRLSANRIKTSIKFKSIWSNNIFYSSIIGKIIIIIRYFIV